MKKVIWIHNFNPAVKGSGVFMYQAYEHFARSYPKLKIDIIYLGNLKNPLVVLMAIFRVVFFSFKYDILHAQFGSMCAFIGAFFFKKKIVTLRGSDWYKKNSSDVFGKWHGRLQNWLTNFSLRRYDMVVAVSNRMAKEVKDRFPRLRTVVIPSPIDLDKFLPKDKFASKQEIGLEFNGKVFLYPVVNLNNPVKRPEFISELTKLLPANIKIMPATGYDHSRMCALYNAVDAVLLPSQYEGWPNVIKECLACDTPFISTDISDLAEIAAIHDSCKILDLDLALWKKTLIAFSGDEEDLRTSVEWMSLDNLNRKLFSECYSS